MTTSIQKDALLSQYLRLLQATLWLFTTAALCPAAAQTQRPTQERNAASQRYEINQTFDGQSFLKDNNVWVYTKEFADLFGMPAQYIEDVQGVAAAAFRIEDTSYQRCGFGGRVDACQKVEQCVIDLYFDESKTPLPWATDIKSQWLPWNSSMRWIRTAKPNPAFRGEISEGVIPNKIQQSPLIPFADPVTRREAIFTSNVRTSMGNEDEVSGALVLIGYTHNFFQQISIVNLQFGCAGPDRAVVNIRLDAKSYVVDPPIARFNKVTLPKEFVRRIAELIKVNNNHNAVFYRSLFVQPLGTKGNTETSSSPTTKP